jgi:hypothetical protein
MKDGSSPQSTTHPALWLLSIIYHGPLCNCCHLPPSVTVATSAAPVFVATSTTLWLLPPLPSYDCCYPRNPPWMVSLSLALLSLTLLLPSFYSCHLPGPSTCCQLHPSNCCHLPTLSCNRCSITSLGNRSQTPPSCPVIIDINLATIYCIYLLFIHHLCVN